MIKGRARKPSLFKREENSREGESTPWHHPENYLGNGTGGVFDFLMGSRGAAYPAGGDIAIDRWKLLPRLNPGTFYKGEALSRSFQRSLREKDDPRSNPGRIYRKIVLGTLRELPSQEDGTSRQKPEINPVSFEEDLPGIILKSTEDICRNGQRELSGNNREKSREAAGMILEPSCVHSENVSRGKCSSGERLGRVPGGSFF